MINKLIIAATSFLFVFLAANVSAELGQRPGSNNMNMESMRSRPPGWDRGNPVGWERGKHWGWQRFSQRGPLSQAWDILTHPSTAFAEGQVVKNSEGAYQLTIKGDDFAVGATFPISPTLKDRGKDLIRYEAFSPKMRAAYSLIFVGDREAAGFARSKEEAVNEIMARYNSLSERIKVDGPTLTKPDAKEAGRFDQTMGYHFQPTDARFQNLSAEVAERVIMIDKAMVIITVAAPKLGPEAMNFLNSVDLTVAGAAPAPKSADTGEVVPAPVVPGSVILEPGTAEPAAVPSGS